MQVTISDAIRYIGVDDKDIDLFESQYVVPEGVSYNSYVIWMRRLQLWIRLMSGAWKAGRISCFRH